MAGEFGPVVAAGLSIAAAFVAGLFGGVVSPWVTHRLRHTDRQHELYRSVYPVKVEAAKRIMEKSDALEDAVGRLENMMMLTVLEMKAGKNFTRGPVATLLEPVMVGFGEVEQAAFSTEWILGSEVRRCAVRYCSACGLRYRPLEQFGRGQGPFVPHDLAISLHSSAESRVALQALMSAVARAVHLHPSDKMLPAEARITLERDERQAPNDPDGLSKA